jgi:hypothetical protein
MAEKLERIFEYRVLLAKAGLSAAERTQLEHLGSHIPDVVPALDERDPYTLLIDPLPAEVLDSDGIMPGLVRNAGAGGLALSVSQPPALGRLLAVRVRDPRHPIEYTFPARVVSRVVRGLRGISVAFEGMPLQSPLVGRGSGVWRAAFDRRPRDPRRAI